MKRILLITLAVAFFTPVFSQQKKKVTENYHERDYMKISKRQKNTAVIMLAGGILIFGGSALYFLTEGHDNSPSSSKYKLGKNGIIVGGVFVVGSIPFFVLAKENRERAMAGSAGLKIECQPVISGAITFNKPYPALAFKLNF